MQRSSIEKDGNQNDIPSARFLKFLHSEISCQLKLFSESVSLGKPCSHSVSKPTDIYYFGFIFLFASLCFFRQSIRRLFVLASQEFLLILLPTPLQNKSEP